MNTPLVSCIVPAFNSGRYIGEALDSILGQTWAGIEAIVVDDGSTDDTADVVLRYGDAVTCITRDNGGPAATRNAGLAVASGDFVAFLDADDLWEPDKLERQVAQFAANPALEASVTHARMFWVSQLAHEAEEYRENPRTEGIPGYATTTLLARRALFDRVGVFREDLWFSDATEWFIRARERGVNMEILPDVLTLHRMHENNLTRRRSEASKAEFARIVGESLIRRRSTNQPASP